jgi:AcrR family transcriptional regulator
VEKPTDRPTKGAQTRAAILDEALSIASKLGLEGLTIGSLADATGMSKSGLFAHFGSREDLQLAVLEHAAQRYGEQVLMPALRIERGLPRLQAIFERWLDWAAASGLPGGCIMISAANEYDDRPGAKRCASRSRRGTSSRARTRSRSPLRCSASSSPATTTGACSATRKRASALSPPSPS